MPGFELSSGSKTPQLVEPVKITFLGTGTSAGVPVIACDCDTSKSTDSRDKRWRPSVHLELDDGTSVLIDASPDLRAQAIAFGLTRVDRILLTHALDIKYLLRRTSCAQHQSS